MIKFCNEVHILLIRKQFFLPKPKLSQHNTKNQADIFLIFFLPFISLFFSVVYLARFIANNKHHFLTYILTGAFISALPFFNLSVFTAEMVVLQLIMKAESNVLKKKKCYSLLILYLVKSSVKRLFKNCNWGT